MKPDKSRATNPDSLFALYIALELLQCFPYNTNGIPDDHGIGHQIEAMRLIELVVRIAFTNLSFLCNHADGMVQHTAV
jgi:hypothetical protein